MIAIGLKVYYIDEGMVHSGHIMDIEERASHLKFQIDSYGTCEGQYLIDEEQIGKTVFYAKAEAEAALHKHLNYK